MKTKTLLCNGEMLNHVLIKVVLLICLICISNQFHGCAPASSIPHPEDPTQINEGGGGKVHSPPSVFTPGQDPANDTAGGIELTDMELSNCGVEWSVNDPDDPAESGNIDPNGNNGNDNQGGPGRMVPDFTWVPEHQNWTSSRFHSSSDQNGLFHPGDNYEVKASVDGGVQISYSKYIYLWRRMFIHYDEMLGRQADFAYLQDAFEGVSRFNPKNTIGADKCAYHWYKDEYRNNHEMALEDVIWVTDPQMYAFAQQHAVNVPPNISEVWAIFMAGVNRLETHPDWAGCAWPNGMHQPPGEAPWAVIFVGRINQLYPQPPEHDWLMRQSIIHELGHEIGDLPDGMTHPLDHTDSTCVMFPAWWGEPPPSLHYHNTSQDPHFCDVCIRKLRDAYFPVFRDFKSFGRSSEEILNSKESQFPPSVR